MIEQVLTTVDGVRISATLSVGIGPSVERGLCFVLVHGFTGNWRQERVTAIAERLRAFADVIALDMRGHGRSSGATTVGMDEIHDVAAGVRWARSLGYERVVTIGFSLGGAVVLREAALEPDASVDAVVAVSAPAFWYYKGTRIMRIAHRMVETRIGRAVMRAGGTRVSAAGWPEEAPVPPHAAAAMLGPTPLLIVHGDVDRYFPLEHPKAIHASALDAGVPVDLWIETGFGHAERAVSPDLADRIGRWAVAAVHPASTRTEGVPGS